MNAQFGTVQGKRFDPGLFIGPEPLLLTKRSRRFAIYGSMIVLDGIAAMLGFMLANLIFLDNPLASPALKLSGLVIPAFLALALNNGAYTLEALYDRRRGTARGITSLFAAGGFILFVLYGLGLLKEHHPAFIAAAVAASSLLIAAGRVLSDGMARRLLQNNPISELIIVDGISHAAKPDCDVVDAQAAGIQPDMSDPLMLDRLGQMLRQRDRVTVACAPERRGDWAMVLRGAAIEGEVHSDPEPRIPPHASIVPLTAMDFTLKRLIDLMLVIPALVFLAPLLALVAIAIKLESPGPILFVQQRLGHGNRLFRMWKFRSMRNDLSDADGNISASRDDARITRIGRFLRATSIDELPQLFNVLAGNMSLVGPRPHALGSTASSKLFWEIDRNYWLRHACMPGLTGLAQVRGFRGATLHEADLENRLAADLEYVRDWSLWLDIAILCRTFGVVIHRNAF